MKISHDAPCFIKVDNGPESILKELDKWAYENKVTLDFSRPGSNQGLAERSLRGQTTAHWTT
ncbi:MAG: hypothetical protein JW967_11220 [Dehalococcoidales bacterium]|nr:hypothetical protein [Dehalococcoidales bacterium]